jgi:transposase InsO family protein
MIDFAKTAFQVSIRRACRAVPAPRSTYHYRSIRPPQDVLRKRIRELAETHVRYGYRRIHILLRREGWPINVKRVRRLYNLEGLQMRLKPPRRRVMAKLRSDRSDAIGPNQVWAMDWMFDETFDGKRLWVLTVIDTWSRVCPVMRVCRSATAMAVIDALEEACHTHGYPKAIRVDQGSHVWMPPLMQAVLEHFGHVIGYGHVSGLQDAALHMPRAGMEMRGSGADQFSEREGSGYPFAFPGPDLIDHLPLLFLDLLTSPTHRRQTTVRRSGSRYRRTPVVLPLRQHGPGGPRHLVGERHRYQHARLARQHFGEPRPRRCTLP